MAHYINRLILEEEQTMEQDEETKEYTCPKQNGLNRNHTAEEVDSRSEENNTGELALDNWESLIQWCVDKDVSSTFDECVEKVQQLQIRRDELVQEICALKEPMEHEVQKLRLQITLVSSQLADTLLQKQKLQQEVTCLKRKLFGVARDCIQSQVALTKHQYEVAQFVFVQEELQMKEMNLVQELQHVRDEQHCRLQTLQQRQSRPRTRSDLTHCRRFSADLTKYTQSAMMNLQQWFEPRLLALLRRSQLSEQALRNNSELKNDLKIHLKPLKEETHSLRLQRNKLQSRLDLMEQERAERLAQHKESVSSLEERVRNLKTQIQIQNNRNRDAAELRDILTAKCLLYRRYLGYSEESQIATEELLRE